MPDRAISVSGAFAVLTSLFIASVAGKLERKLLLLLLTGLMVGPRYLVKVVRDAGLVDQTEQLREALLIGYRTACPTHGWRGVLRVDESPADIGP